MELKVPNTQNVSKGDETPKTTASRRRQQMERATPCAPALPPSYWIARRYGLTVEQVKKLNPTSLTGNTQLAWGQVLKVK